MLRVSLFLACLLPPLASAGCNEPWAVNYNTTDADNITCHGPPHHLAFVVAVPGEFVAGTLLEPAPVVELRDAEQRRVLVHGGRVVVTAKYQVAIWQRASDGSTVKGSAGRKVTGDYYLFMRSWPVKVEAGRANFTGVVRETTAGAYNITFIVRGASENLMIHQHDTVHHDTVDHDTVHQHDTGEVGESRLHLEFVVRPAAPALLLLMRQPGGGEACAPLGSQPRLLLKDGYNNTVSLLDGEAVVASAVLGVHPPLCPLIMCPQLLGAGQPLEPAADGTLLGVASQTLAAGGAAFGSLGINSTGRAWRLVFSLDSNSSVGGSGGGIHLTATSDAFDCHGAPAALRSLPGWPPMLEVVDADGVRATGVGSEVELRSYLEFDDGGLREHGRLVRRFHAPHDVWRADLSPNGGHHPFGMYVTVHNSWYPATSQVEVGLDGVGSMGLWESIVDAATGALTTVSRGDARGYGGSPRYAEAGVWAYTHATDPLRNQSDAATAIALIFRANISGNLSLDYGREVSAGLVGTDRGLRISGGCCELLLDEEVFPLYVPQIRIVRLRALNTGLQGGYGRGDSIEVAFNIKTDRAGLPLREVFDRTILERLVLLGDDENVLRNLDARRRRVRSSLGDSPASVSGVWADNCTLLIVAGRNVSGAFSETGVTTARVRDDILELYDMRRRLRRPSTARSVLLSGSFGATPGLDGRGHPLRQVLDTDAMRRREPEFPSQHGPFDWHEGGTGDIGDSDTREHAAAARGYDDTVYGMSECEAEAPSPSMASFESRYGAERWTAIEGYYNPETKRMVHIEEPQVNMEAWSHVYRGTSSSGIWSDVPTVYGGTSEPEAPQSQAPLTWQRRHVGPWTTGGRADGGSAAAAAAAAAAG